MTRLLAIVIAVLLGVCWLQGSRISALKLAAQQAETQAVTAERDRADALVRENQALAKTNRQMATERDALKEKADEAKRDMDTAVAAADAMRLQHKADTDKLTARLQKRARDARTDGEREASAQAIGVLAELHGRLDARAGGYAAEADRSRLAGTTCESEYDTFRAGYQAWLNAGP